MDLDEEESTNTNPQAVRYYSIPPKGKEILERVLIIPSLAEGYLICTRKSTVRTICWQV
jgi:hypothetical protein